MIREKFSPKKILLITLLSLAVIGMGVLYVTAGSVMDQVPKTEVVRSSGDNHLELASQSAPSFPTLNQTSSGSAGQPAGEPAPATPQEPAALNENASDTGNAKRNTPLTNVIKGAKAKLRQ